jgi:predicted mannosyl-3-phosphoglycerate phosphatase (HAD superfamily)
MHPPPDNVARELRAAVLASNHEKATRLTAEYTAAVREHWTTLPSQERAASHLPKQSLELLAWVREMTILQQALAAQHLAAVEKASRYQAARALYLRSAALEGI